jgi:hypothetical protein
MIWYCICIKCFSRKYFHCILGKKTNSKHPIIRYYSLYIRHNFFCCPEDHENHLFSKLFFTSTNLIIFGFQEVCGTRVLEDFPYFFNVVLCLPWHA